MSINLPTPRGYSKTHNRAGNASPAMASARLPVDYSRLIAEISARLIKVSNEDLDAEILHALREALHPLGVDRGGLIEVFENSPVAKLTHAWYDEGIAHVSGEINLAEMFPWVYQKLVAWGLVSVMAKLDDLPPEADVDRQSYLLMGTKSDLSIPLFIGRRVHHLFAVNSMKVERDWPNEVITHLRLLGEIFVSALQRREAEQKLRSAKDRLNLAAASANAGLWELDIASGALWVTEQAREMFRFEADLALTLEQFMAVVHVEDREMVKAEIDAACHNGKELRIEYRVVLPDGQVRWRDSRGRLQAGAENGHRRLMGVTLDVTQRKLMEQQLQAQVQEIARLKEQLEAENACLRDEMAIREERRGLHAANGCMQAIMDKVEQVASTGSTVLIEGETGTGKELIAESVHRLSTRGKRLMIKVNCAALPAALVESELFGREKGAFTGALSRQAGRFEMADGSTLFLDEIAEIPLETQAKLLRVLQEGEFERLGSPKTIKVDVRVIAATNRNLAVEVEQGRFRRDLYYRLNVFPLHVPPLREHPEDIPQLVWEFVNDLGERMGKKIRRIAARDMEYLKAYPWPGNIRELRNVIEHAMIVSNGESLEIQRLTSVDALNGKPTTLEEIERHHIQNILTVTGGRIKGHGGAAELLGLNPSTLYSRMRKLGISSPRS